MKRIKITQKSPKLKSRKCACFIIITGNSVELCERTNRADRQHIHTAQSANFHFRCTQIDAKRRVNCCQLLVVSAHRARRAHIFSVARLKISVRSGIRLDIASIHSNKPELSTLIRRLVKIPQPSTVAKISICSQKPALLFGSCSFSVWPACRQVFGSIR